MEEKKPSIFERFQLCFNDLSHRHTDGRDLELAKIAATLILAEEIHNLSTSNVSLSQATTDLGTALSNISTVITQAVAALQSDNPAEVQQAANTVEAAAQELNTLATNLGAASSTSVPVASGGVAATGSASGIQGGAAS